MIVIAAADQELVLSVLPAYGTWPPAARVQARWLVDADLRGVGSHGLQRLPMLVRRIERGFIRQEAVSACLDAVRATPVQEGVAALQVPGDRARAERTRRQQGGVEIPDPVWHEALELARGTPGAGEASQPGATPSGHSEQKVTYRLERGGAKFMETAPKQQASRSRASQTARPLGDEDGHVEIDETGRSRSTTGDLLNLIEQLSNFDRIGVTRLARHLQMPVPTAYRMLRALERAGYVEQLAESKEYRLTLKLFELGSKVASRTTLRDVAAVEVERLAQQSGLATNVSLLAGADVLYLAQVKTEELLAVNLTPGSRAPATCTAMGKAMLAAQFRDLKSIVGPGPYPRRTEHSICTYEDLAAELAEVQRRGYAVDRQELNLGVFCVAAPILGVRQTQPAAISVSAYRPQMDGAEEERLGKLVIAAATRISDRVGGLGNLVSW